MITELLPKNVWIRLSTYNSKGIAFTGDSPKSGTTLKCKISYPLSNPCIFDITIPERCRSINYIIDSIVNKYREIYEEEDRSKTETIPSGTVLNRGFTNGTYGVWGHALSDLDLVSIKWDTETNELSLGVDS